jgi:putative ABC transport system permease protein
MLLVTLAALLASALAVSAAMATAIFERRHEVGLMKTLGADNAAVAALFFAESGLLSLLSGTAGFLIGIAMAKQIGQRVFGARVAVEPVLFPIIVAVAVLVTFAGSAASIRRAIHFSPAIVLRGDV